MTRRTAREMAQDRSAALDAWSGAPADLWGIIGKLSAEHTDAVALDLDAIHETICDNFTGMAEVQQAADLLVAEVRRLVKYRDWWKASSLANAEDVRRLAAICHDWRDRSEAAEAEVVTLRARLAAVVDEYPHADTCGSMLTPGADYPCSCWQADLRAALATTGEGHVPALIAALWEARETNARLNRRAQITEAAIADLTREPAGGRKHRAVAAEVWERCEESHGLACRTTREAWAEVRRLRGRLLSDEPPMEWCAVCGRPIWEGDRLCCGTRNGAPVGSAAAAETGSAPFPHSGTPATVEAVSVAHSGVASEQPCQPCH